MQLTHKMCKSCGKYLTIDNFTKSKMIKDGYENKCRKCRTNQKKKHIFQCKFCGENFKSSSKITKFCSSICHGASRRKRVDVQCSFCNKKIEVIKYKIGKHDDYYCNQKCKTEHLKVLMKGRGNPNFNRVKYNCDGCGE